MGESHPNASMPPSVPFYPSQQGSNTQGGAGHPQSPGHLLPYAHQSFPQPVSESQPLSTPHQQRSYYHLHQPQSSCTQVSSPRNLSSNTPYLYPAQSARSSYFCKTSNPPPSSFLQQQLDHHPHGGGQLMPPADQVPSFQPPTQCQDSNLWSHEQASIHWPSGSLQQGSPSGTTPAQGVRTSTGLSPSLRGAHCASNSEGEFTRGTSPSSSQQPGYQEFSLVGSAGGSGRYPLVARFNIAPKAQGTGNSTDPLQVCLLLVTNCNFLYHPPQKVLC